MTASPPPYAWLDGAVVPWERCVLHARSAGAFWGANVFEGIRAYWDAADRQLRVFRLADHVRRLHRSMKCVRMDLEYSDADIRAAVMDLLRANDFREDVHVTVVAYFALSAATLDPIHQTSEAGMHITAVPMPRRDSFEHGVAARVSSWRRISDESMPPRIKTGANYHNSRLAQHEAARDGYDTALILNQRGTVAEAPGACLAMVRDGRLVTPPGTSGVLEGITLDTLEKLARAELGITMEHREIDRTELYLADEAFLAGTVVEVLPVVSLDRLPIGEGTPGPLTRQLQELFDVIVHSAAHPAGWIDPVYAESAQAAVQ